MQQKYGTLIREEREKKDLSADVLANILLMDVKTLHQIEEGKEEMSDVRLNICANIFHLSKMAMVDGKRLDILSDTAFMLRVEEIKKQIAASLSPEKAPAMK